MKTYDDLKSELPKILEIVEKAPESVQNKVLETLVASFLGGSVLPAATPTPARGSSAVDQEQLGASRGRKKRASGESYQIDRALSLRGGGEFGSFREFHSTKAPTSAAEFNAVAVYFLVHKVGIAQPTFNQLYTCYKDVGRRTPEFFKQSVVDTKNKQGWIDLTGDNCIVITHRGTEFVEHDLPRLKTERKKN